MMLDEIYKNFDENGIFPTDSQMIQAIKNNSNYDSIYQLELEMIDKALADENHPYHHMVIPIK